MIELDGHDIPALREALTRIPLQPCQPSVVIAHTVKGRGVRRMEFDTNWHVGNLVGAEYDDVIEEIKGGLQPLVTGGGDG